MVEAGLAGEFSTMIPHAFGWDVPETPAQLRHIEVIDALADRR
jgi:hypothetical protein